jgi:SAM-dependent methyltransferase
MTQSFQQTSAERVREFWNRRPCNVRHSPKPVGTREYFDEVEARKYRVESHIPKFAEFERWRGKKVLEIGCGIGTDTVNFARHGADVTAIDLSDKSVEIATQRVAVYNLRERVRFYQGNAEELATIVPLSQYDLVYSFGVIHHSPHPEKIIAQLPAYMGPQSELRLMVYAKCSYKLFWIMKEEGVWDLSRSDELIARNSEAQTGCPVTYSYTFDGARTLLAPFEITRMQKAHIFTWDISAYRRFEYKKDAAWANVPDDLVASLEKELGWHLLVWAKLRS